MSLCVAGSALSARLLQGADIELMSMKFLFEAAIRMSIEIDYVVLIAFKY